MLQLHAIRVADIMTPRTVVFSLPLDTPLDEFARKIRGVPYTRVPVFDRQSDNIRGFVIKHEVLGKLTDGGPASEVEALLRALPGVLDEVPVDRLFRRMISEQLQILAVMDEFGTFLGLVTLEDVLETIFGFEIVDELDEVPDLQGYARELAQRRAAGAGRIAR